MFFLKVQDGIISDVIIYPEMDISRTDKKMLIKMLNFIVFLWIKPQKMRHQLKVQNIGHLYTILKGLIFKVIKISRNKITETT